MLLAVVCLCCFRGHHSTQDTIQGTLFDGCLCSVDRATQTKLWIQDCDIQNQNLILSKDSMGNVFVDPIFVNDTDKTIKQKTITFTGNEGLMYVNWNVFQLGSTAMVKLDEVIFLTYNPQLKVEIRKLDNMVSIHTLSVMALNSASQVNLISLPVIWLQIHADFVDDTNYIGKFLYGTVPTNKVTKIAVWGETGKSYRLTDFFGFLFSALISVESLEGLRLNTLPLLGVNMDLSVMLKGATKLKYLLLEQITYDQEIKSDFMQKILGDSFIDNCTDGLSVLPMEMMTVEFANANEVQFQKGALGKNCPQSKWYGDAETSAQMVWAWGQQGARQCLVSPQQGQNLTNMNDDVCAACLMNAEGSADVKPNCANYGNGNRLDSLSASLRPRNITAVIALTISVAFSFFF